MFDMSLELHEKNWLLVYEDRDVRCGYASLHRHLKQKEEEQMNVCGDEKE